MSLDNRLKHSIAEHLNKNYIDKQFFYYDGKRRNFTCRGDWLLVYPDEKDTSLKPIPIGNIIGFEIKKDYHGELHGGVTEIEIKLTFSNLKKESRCKEINSILSYFDGCVDFKKLISHIDTHLNKLTESAITKYCNKENQNAVKKFDYIVNAKINELNKLVKDADSLIRNKSILLLAYYRSLTIDDHNNILVDEGKMVTLIKNMHKDASKFSLHGDYLIKL